MACYALGPGDGASWLTPAEVVERLRAAFTWFECNAQEGITYASRVLIRMKEMHVPQQVIDHLEQRYEDSIGVAISDCGPLSEHRLTFVVMPEESIKVYAEPHLLPLVKQCMGVLGYDMMEL